jgi:hypothetical protein
MRLSVHNMPEPQQMCLRSISASRAPRLKGQAFTSLNFKAHEADNDVGIFYVEEYDDEQAAATRASHDGLAQRPPFAIHSLIGRIGSKIRN